MSNVKPIRPEHSSVEEVIADVLAKFPHQSSIVVTVFHEDGLKKKVRTFYCCDAAQMALAGAEAIRLAGVMLWED